MTCWSATITLSRHASSSRSLAKRGSPSSSYATAAITPFPFDRNSRRANAPRRSSPNTGPAVREHLHAWAVGAGEPGNERDRHAESISTSSAGAPWTPPECAPRLVAALATGEFDALAGRYLHAERDTPEELRNRIDTILADDLNAIRLQR